VEPVAAAVLVVERAAGLGVRVEADVPGDEARIVPVHAAGGVSWARPSDRQRSCDRDDPSEKPLRLPLRVGGRRGTAEPAWVQRSAVDRCRGSPRLDNAGGLEVGFKSRRPDSRSHRNRASASVREPRRVAPFRSRPRTGAGDTPSGAFTASGFCSKLPVAAFRRLLLDREHELVRLHLSSECASRKERVQL